MAAVTVKCRGVKLHVTRGSLHRAPLLLKACSSETDDINEEVSLDRDPEAVRMVLEYCTTGIITQQMLTDGFFAEADYFGVAPQLPLLQQLRETLTYEELCYDTGIFVERLINTNSQRWRSGFSGNADDGFMDPVFKLLMKCERYEPRDRWAETVDAFKYVEAHPDILRSVAFTRFGVSMTWHTRYVDIDVPETSQDNSNIDWENLKVYPSTGGRIIHNGQSWTQYDAVPRYRRTTAGSASSAKTGQCRLGYTATDAILAQSSTPSDHCVFSMQQGSTVTLQCSGVAVEFSVCT
jgi:BTB/POZ domain